MTHRAAGRPFSHLSPRQAHLIGIAGSGMRALADVLLGWGWTVGGSDLNIKPVKRLAAAGAILHQNHSAENVPLSADLVVHSSAIPPGNPELLRAAELDIPTLSYFQMLGRMCEGRNVAAIAGTHGKSTVTAMTAHLTAQAGGDPTVVCGATPLGATSGGRAGRSRLMLVEACEYRQNFLQLKPHNAAILAVEPDHFDCYRSLGELEAAFGRFAALLPDDGLLIARHDCHSTRRAAAQARCRIETFGLSPDADWSAVGITSRPVAASDAVGANNNRGLMEFEMRRFGRRFCDVRLCLPGLHNVLNALAAAALAHANGVSAEQIAAGLSDFAGLHHRMEYLGERWGVAMIDDYAHHPSEVRAALAAARLMFPNRRLWCVFQPHQASRTAMLLDDLAESLQNADKVLVAEIFRAREADARPGDVSADDLARKAADLGADVFPGHADSEISETLEAQLAPGDVLITLGAGNHGRKTEITYLWH
ncbi:MAG: UDP-N-acetylmuramate--L-alanine ligase [Pirellulaceae bacterium]|nr:UDP-N-acetylmuramate--L-alanine ligase [Pirellulaceae bacterium]